MWRVCFSVLLEIKESIPNPNLKWSVIILNNLQRILCNYPHWQVLLNHEIFTAYLSIFFIQAHCQENLYNVALSRPCLFYIWASANPPPSSPFSPLQPPPVCAYRIFALNQKPKLQRNSRKRRRQQKKKKEVASQHCGTVRNKTIDILEHCKDWAHFFTWIYFFPSVLLFHLAHL